jgi:hypothetical protein
LRQKSTRKYQKLKDRRCSLLRGDLDQPKRSVTVMAIQSRCYLISISLWFTPKLTEYSILIIICLQTSKPLVGIRDPLAAQKVEYFLS